ncbi:hypothetical protein [Gluconobacter oxydans]|uniref:hypothetical protein n=1 Tax=Gluconobacter oxydans TaxID=442 RepID=UPI002649A6AF|nr:hypothetical protein [Gluconobacter oxydans]WKE49058.1 hypothetical protein NUJ38_04910 [Gluconobacter oxydans]
MIALQIIQVVSAAIMLAWAVYRLAQNKDGFVGKAIYFFSASASAAMLWPVAMDPHFVSVRDVTLEASCALLIVYHNTIRIYRKCRACRD